MSINEIRQHWKRTPFQPFTIQLSDGTGLPVPTRDHLSIPPLGQVVVIWNTSGEGGRYIAPIHITAISFEQFPKDHLGEEEIPEK